MRNEDKTPDPGPADFRSAIRVPSSAFSAWLSLVALTARRQWRTRSLGLVTFALLGMMTAIVAVVTHAGNGWWLEKRIHTVTAFEPADDKGNVKSVRLTAREYGDERLTQYQMLPGTPDMIAARALAFAPYRAVVRDQEYLGDYAFLSFSRWVVFGLYLGFLLPLFSLAYASGALGGEREDRTLVWLVTRPLPRPMIYLAKFVGVLPWCVAVSAIGFVALCLAGGEPGRRALFAYWPAVLAGAVGYAALFHLIGATVRRPAVVGLVYIFFFEVLVANLPGSLKRLSLNYYARSLAYNEAAREAPAVAVPDVVDVYEPVSALTAVCVLLVAAAVVTLLGSWLFARLEPGEET